jgi:hypothetical protein
MPDPNGIGGRRDKRAIAADRKIPDADTRVAQRLQLTALGDLPSHDTTGSVRVHEQASVVAESQWAEGVAASGDRPQLFAGGDFPDTNRSAASSAARDRRNQTAIGAEHDPLYLRSPKDSWMPVLNDELWLVGDTFCTKADWLVEKHGYEQRREAEDADLDRTHGVLDSLSLSGGPPANQCTDTLAYIAEPSRQGADNRAHLEPEHRCRSLIPKTLLRRLAEKLLGPRHGE